MRLLAITALLFGFFSLGIFGVFTLWVLDRHESALAETEAAQQRSGDPMGNGLPELLQGQRDKLNIARTVRLGSGVVGAGLMLLGLGLLTRRRGGVGA